MFVKWKDCFKILIALVYSYQLKLCTSVFIYNLIKYAVLVLAILYQFSTQNANSKYNNANFNDNTYMYGR